MATKTTEVIKEVADRMLIPFEDTRGSWGNSRTRPRCLARRRSRRTAHTKAFKAFGESTRSVAAFSSQASHSSVRGVH